MSDWQEERQLLSILINIRNAGGGGTLSKDQAQLLMRHEAYTSPSHPQHAEVSKTVREFYETEYPGHQNPHG